MIDQCSLLFYRLYVEHCQCIFTAAITLNPHRLALSINRNIFYYCALR
jgi:hypothetical protein